MWIKTRIALGILGLSLVACSGVDDQDDNQRNDARSPAGGTTNSDSTDSGDANDGGAGSTDSGAETGGQDQVNGGDDRGTGGTDDGPPAAAQVAGPTRQEGKLPLYVYFNGIEAVKDFLGLESEEDFDFMNYTFVWDFDSEIKSATTRHRFAVGFNVGHVFEEARKYTTTLWVYDEKGHLLDDPTGMLTWEVKPSEFQGETVYVAEREDGARGSGSESDPFSSVTEALGQAKDNMRILLRRGDTFVVNNNMDLKTVGDILVSSYPNEDDQNAPNPIIHTTEKDSSWYIFSIQGSGWRFKDIKFTGEGATMESPRISGGVSTAEGSRENLIIDCQFENLSGNVVYIAGDSNAVFDSTFSRFGNYAFYMYDEAGQRHSVVGNSVFDMGGNSFEHVLRMQQSRYTFIGENHFEATHSKSNVQIRGDSSYVVIWNNVLDRVIGINPQNNTSEEYQRYVSFDSNIVIGREDPSFSSEYPIRQGALRITAQDVTVRNNVFYNYMNAIRTVDHPLVVGSERVHIYNNSILCGNGDCVGLESEQQTKDVRFIGNVVAAVGSDPGTISVIKLRSPTAELTSEYNFSFKTAGGETRYEGDSGSRDLAAWRNSTGQDMHSVDSVDPKFGSTPFDEASTLVTGTGARLFVDDFLPYWVPAATTLQVIPSDAPFIPVVDLYFRERSVVGMAGAVALLP